MESTQVPVKKPRAPRVKKTKDAPVVQQIAEEAKEAVVEEVKVIEKKKVIISFDPGFIKMGLAVLDAEDAKIVETRCIQLRKQGEK